MVAGFIYVVPPDTVTLFTTIDAVPLKNESVTSKLINPESWLNVAPVLIVNVRHVNAPVALGAFIVDPDASVIVLLLSQVHAVFPPNTPPLFTVTAPVKVQVDVLGVRVPVMLLAPVTVVGRLGPIADKISVPAVIIKAPATLTEVMVVIAVVVNDLVFEFIVKL